MSVPTSYCAYTDVQSKLQRTYTDTPATVPTKAEVSAFCVTIFNRLNGLLDARGYAVPINTSYTAASAILKDIATLGASALAEEAANAISQTGSVSPLAVSLREQWEAEIRHLTKGETSLVDAPDSSAVPANIADSAPVGTFNLDTDGDERDSTFTRVMEF